MFKQNSAIEIVEEAHSPVYDKYTSRDTTESRRRADTHTSSDPRRGEERRGGVHMDTPQPAGAKSSMGFLNFGKSTYIHVLGEVLVVGGLFYYFNSKIKKLRAELDLVKKDVEDMKTVAKNNVNGDKGIELEKNLEEVHKSTSGHINKIYSILSNFQKDQDKVIQHLGEISLNNQTKTTSTPSSQVLSAKFLSTPGGVSLKDIPPQKRLNVLNTFFTTHSSPLTTKGPSLELIQGGLSLKEEHFSLSEEDLDTENETDFSDARKIMDMKEAPKAKYFEEKEDSSEDSVDLDNEIEAELLEINLRKRDLGRNVTCALNGDTCELAGIVDAAAKEMVVDEQPQQVESISAKKPRKPRRKKSEMAMIGQ